MRWRYLLLAWALAAPAVTSAHELTTHALLTQEAYSNSDLGSPAAQVIHDLGLADRINDLGSTYYDWDFPSNSFISRSENTAFEDPIENSLGVAPNSIQGWLLRGAIREDDFPGSPNNENDPYFAAYGKLYRPLDHFFDPYYNRPLSVPLLSLFEPILHKAPDWAVGTDDVFVDSNTGGTAFDHIDFTCQDGGAVQTVQGPSTALNPCTYTTAGYYTAQVNVYALPVGTSQAPIFTGVQMIQADSALTINAVALGAYYDMLNQLMAGNVQGALNDVTGTVYDKYSAVFASVVTDPNLKTIIPKQFMNIVDGTISNGHAEYILSRDINGVATGFFIDFVKGEDGVWRIEGM
jgi:hypothetical protein